MKIIAFSVCIGTYIGLIINFIKYGELNEMIFCAVLIAMSLCSIASNIRHKNNKEGE